MNKQLIILAAVIIGLTFSSCFISINGETVKGDGNVVTRDYDVAHFDEIVCALPATVNYTVADAYSCTVRVDSNLLEYIDIKVKDGELSLSQPKPMKNGIYLGFNATEFVIDVTAPSLNAITLAGSGDINILSPMEAQHMEVTVAGSGDVAFKEDVDIQHLELSVAGSGDIMVDKGTIRKLEADIAGSGDIVAHAEAQEVEATVMGSGDITTNVSGTLEYQVVGSGDIHYYGDAKVNGKVAGSGALNRIDAPSR